MADRVSVSRITDDPLDIKGHAAVLAGFARVARDRQWSDERIREAIDGALHQWLDGRVAADCAASAGAPVSPEQTTDHADLSVSGITEDMVEKAATELLSDYASEYVADHLTWRDFEGDARRALSAALAGCTVVPEPPERGEVAARMARGRQWIAHTNSNRMGMPVPAWDALTPAEQERAETEARYWIQAAVNTGVKIVPPGWTVVALPEPDGVDDDVTVWSYTGTDEVHAYVEDGRAYVGYLCNNDDPDQAEHFGLALVAAAREARRLADGSQVGDQHV